jgi:hypothetical protein
MKSIAIVLAGALAFQPAFVLAAGDKKPAAPAAAKPGVAMPKSPLSDKELKDALKALGPKGSKVKIPTFKKGATAKQKAAKIKRLDRLIARVKVAKKTPAHLQAGVRVWEALTMEQKQAVISGDALADPTVTGWVAVGIAVVAFAYYVADTQNWVADDKAKEPEPKDDEGGDEEGDTGDGGDGGDTGFHTLDY